MYILKVNHLYEYHIDNFSESFSKEINRPLLTVTGEVKSADMEAVASLSQFTQDVDTNSLLHLQIYYNDNLILESDQYVLKTADISSQKHNYQEGDEPVKEDIVLIYMIFGLDIEDEDIIEDEIEIIPEDLSEISEDEVIIE